jgi:hypothetical protein
MFFDVNFLSFDGQKNETKICPKDFWGKVGSKLSYFKETKVEFAMFKP